MKRLVLIGVAALAGCSSLNDAQGTCSAKNADYSQMWDCIRGRVAAGNAGMMNNEMGIRYMAFGDALNEKYKAGRVSSADAKYLLAQELARGNAEFNAQYKPIVCTSNKVYNSITTSCY